MANNIPSVWAAGSFKASEPFSSVVKENVYYTVEAVRTISEMQSLKLDLFKLVFGPAGVTQENYQTQLDECVANKAVIVTLTSRGAGPVYVPSTKLLSFPVIDGVVYEHMCLVTNLGAVPPSFKDKINVAKQHFDDYILSAFGVNANTVIATIPTRSYVSKETAEDWEVSRKNKITGESSDLIKLNKALAELSSLKAYVKELEDALKQK